MPTELSAIPYKHRSAAAGLLISKANRLAELLDLSPTELSTRQRRSLRAGVAFYDMALLLSKPYDPNYITVLNWRCLALAKLGRYEDAVAGYRELLRIAAEVNGKGPSDPTATLAAEQIRTYAGKPNEAFEEDEEDTGLFDDPPFGAFGREFCELLLQGKYKQAHKLLTPKLQAQLPLPDLKARWDRLIGGAAGDAVCVSLEQHLVDSPLLTSDDVAWCYYSITGPDINEAASLVIRKTTSHSYQIARLELGRP